MCESARQLTLKATQHFWLIKFSRRVTDEHHFCNGSLPPDPQLLRAPTSPRRPDVSYDLKNKAPIILIHRAIRILILLYCSTLQGVFNSVARGLARPCHNAASRLPKLSDFSPQPAAHDPLPLWLTLALFFPLSRLTVSPPRRILFPRPRRPRLAGQVKVSCRSIDKAATCGTCASDVAIVHGKWVKCTKSVGRQDVATCRLVVGHVLDMRVLAINMILTLVNTLVPSRN